MKTVDQILSRLEESAANYVKGYLFARGMIKHIEKNGVTFLTMDRLSNIADHEICEYRALMKIHSFLFDGDEEGRRVSEHSILETGRYRAEHALQEMNGVADETIEEALDNGV